MIEPHCCFIEEQYFIDHPGYIKLLDVGDTQKQARRTHVCVAFNVEGNSFYIPLRKNLGDAVRKYGRIGHAVSSADKPMAGLDFRHALLINDKQYIAFHTREILARSQYRIIASDYTVIQREFQVYVNKHVKMACKNRIDREALFRDSSLVNFHSELGLGQLE